MENAILSNRRNFAEKEIKSESMHLSSYQILICLFMIGSVLGFLMEGIWVIIKSGYWESHSATIWGPFCVIYGIGTIAVYLISCFFTGKNILTQFGAFFFSGALIEYFSSLFQELCFGSVSWNYNDHLLNIGGRVSLQMALMWGVLGILFMRFAFPFLKKLFSKLRGKQFNVLCGVMTVFIAINLACTSVVLLRWKDRTANISASNGIERLIDTAYGDAKMEELFPNMQFLDT